MASKADMEDFVNIFVNVDQSAGADSPHGPHGPHHGAPEKRFYQQWVQQGSAHHFNPKLQGVDKLRQLYPNHAVVVTDAYDANILGLPGISLEPLDLAPPISQPIYIPLPRGKEIPGFLVNSLIFGAFHAKWLAYEYIIVVISHPTAYGEKTVYFILSEEGEDVARLLILAAGKHANDLHDEIWVFDQGFWDKNAALWTEIHKADWKDVILKDSFKQALQKDVYGFFDSEELYKELSIPWKRGLILWGPPGNGKTISLKAIMKTCADKDIPPLYVKSFHGWAGDEASMKMVFAKARQLAPCMLILEDLDSLITDQNRSFFLNELDGLEGNDGLLIVGTTNHFDRLDPGLSSRPSRFDRKYKFDDPDEGERRLYATYWQKKLASNKEIDFPDSLLDEVAKSTDRFSFAYLKEAFVSTLVTYAGIEDKKPPFATLLKQQIDDLRKQLDKPNSLSAFNPILNMGSSSTKGGKNFWEEFPDIRPRGEFNPLRRFYTGSESSSKPPSYGQMPSPARSSFAVGVAPGMTSTGAAFDPDLERLIAAEKQAKDVYVTSYGRSGGGSQDSENGGMAGGRGATPYQGTGQGAGSRERGIPNLSSLQRFGL